MQRTIREHMLDRVQIQLHPIKTKFLGKKKSDPATVARLSQTGYSTSSDFLAAKMQVTRSFNTVAIDQLIDRSINQ